MLQLPNRLPLKRPRPGFARTYYGHMGISMLALAAAGSLGLYRLGEIRRGFRDFDPERGSRERAVTLRTQAAAGDVASQVDLANAYLNGLGVPADPAAAAEWNGKAASQGDDVASLRLADAYARGQGVPWDWQRTIELTRNAAEKGNTEAQFNYGVQRFRGVGIERDVVEGYRWIARAAEGGSTVARTVLEVAQRELSPEELAKARYGRGKS